jgi:hypothetical protein
MDPAGEAAPFDSPTIMPLLCPISHRGPIIPDARVRVSRFSDLEGFPHIGKYCLSVAADTSAFLFACFAQMRSMRAG